MTEFHLSEVARLAGPQSAKVQRPKLPTHELEHRVTHRIHHSTHNAIATRVQREFYQSLGSGRAAERAGKDYAVTAPMTNRDPGARPDLARTRNVMVKNGTPQIEQTDTSVAGAYAVHFADEAGTAVRFASASDPAESDLHELSAADLSALGSVARIVPWTPDADLRGQMERERNGTELWLPFALLAIGLVVAETLLGNRFSRSK